MARKWEKESQGKRDIWIPAPPDPSLPHRYLHLSPVITLMATNMPAPHSQPNFDLAPSSHLIFGEVQDLDRGGHLYNVRQAIQLVQFVAAQVQGQQLWGKKR